MALVVAAAEARAVTQALKDQGETVYHLGALVQGEGPPCVEITGA
jgi:phosphoribosylaminoimidazole (AIR) synthetase